MNPDSFLSSAELWRRVTAPRASLLVDGSAYFGALRSSLLQATERVFIIGWDIDSRTPLRGDKRPDDGAPETLGPLLTHLVERTPTLDVYLLLWDYSVLYALEREPVPRLKLGWRTPPQVHVCLDDELPLASSHHQKIVVVDDSIGFCGGLDLTIRRWDTPEHLPGNPLRVDPADAPYDPFHDAHSAVDGEAAQALAALARQRWYAATGETLPEPGPAGDRWPEGLVPDLPDVDVGIVLTRFEYRDRPALRQVEDAYLKSIEAAERLLYIENQYLTVPKIAGALRDRLRAVPELELLIVNPQMPGGWLEKQTMGVARQRFLDELGHKDVKSRVRIVCPWVGDADTRIDVMVHSKLMFVDDRLLRVGSSNLSCRSMGADSECDLVFEASTRAHRDAINRLRLGLIAEHLGLDADEVAARERATGSMLAALDADEASDRGLASLKDHDLPDESMLEPITSIADPERPIDPAEFVGDLFGAKKLRPVFRRAGQLAAIAAAIGVVLAIWNYTPLADWADPDRVAPLLDGIGETAWRGPLVLFAFVLGSLIVFPVTVLIAATAIALGPLTGFVWALLGSLLGASVTFLVGRSFGRTSLKKLLGRSLNAVARRLRRGGIVPIMVVRNIPIAPFTVVNVVAGATGIRYVDFLIGTALGMGPGIAAVTLLGDRLRSVWEQPTAMNVALLAAAIFAWIGLALGLQALSNRVADGR